ncbi:hypothetical protein GMMP1_100006 [Candidatus Magnetomoraceae bacterium gMMP-1]
MPWKPQLPRLNAQLFGIYYYNDPKPFFDLAHSIKRYKNTSE